MPLLAFSCENFRCLSSVEMAPDERFSLVCGPNASGKTSLLEAIAYLGRGRSIRGGNARDLVTHGADEFLLQGRVSQGERKHRLGVSNGVAGLQQSIDGYRGGSTAELAVILPLQVIDPEVHELVAGAPQGRRRFIDWMAFHVEHDFLGVWRRFRRVLKQRNAQLKAGATALDSWDSEFCEQAEALHRAREQLLTKAVPVLESVASGLLQMPVSFEYSRGWGAGTSLAGLLYSGRGRDLALGSTQAGPQRADLRLKLDEKLAKRLVSRGQQKLLAASMVLGSVQVAAAALGRQPLLLLDDPAAELDRWSLGRLMDAVAALEGQVVATALDAGALPVPAGARRFHVEQGLLSAAD